MVPLRHAGELPGGSGANHSPITASVAAARRIVDQDFADPKLSLGSVSRRLRMSRFHLCRSFRAAFGVGFPAYVTRLRAERAAAGLQDVSLGIKEAAAASGFGGISQLERAFRIRYGCAPKEFRAASCVRAPAASTPAKPSKPSIRPPSRRARL
ncbi:MAG: helix-turn-helix transcriptional regulator [Terriglobales bacterium]